MYYIIFQAAPWWLTVLFGVALCLAIEVPFRLRRFVFRERSLNMDAFTALQAGLLTLASFVLGLSFSQAQGRFDLRRELVVKEANAIGTTWLRSELLQPPQRERFQRILIDYTATRLAAYRRPRAAPSTNGIPAYQGLLDLSNREQNDLWEISASAVHSHPQNLGFSLLMETLNDTIDVSGEQLQALTTHVPLTVIDSTLLLVLLGALSIGLRFATVGSRPIALSAVYVVASVIVVTMMIDYDRPQTGFVTVNLRPLELQLQSMHPPR